MPINPAISALNRQCQQQQQLWSRSLQQCDQEIDDLLIHLANRSELAPLPACELHVQALHRLKMRVRRLLRSVICPVTRCTISDKNSRCTDIRLHVKGLSAILIDGVRNDFLLERRRCVRLLENKPSGLTDN